MRLELVRLHRELKTTMIYVTHDQVEAMTMADRILVLNEGRVEQVASPLELYQNPASLFVAGFIGAPKMNLFEVARERAIEDRCRVTLFHGVALGVPALGAGIAAGAGSPSAFAPSTWPWNRAARWKARFRPSNTWDREPMFMHAWRMAASWWRRPPAIRPFAKASASAFHLSAEACHLFDAAGKRLERASWGVHHEGPAFLWRGRSSPGRIPLPDPAPGEARIRPQAVGICGTDAHIFRGEFPSAAPVVLGHEIGGVVDAVGGGVRGLREGDLVTVQPNTFCGACRYLPGRPRTSMRAHARLRRPHGWRIRRSHGGRRRNHLPPSGRHCRAHRLFRRTSGLRVHGMDRLAIRSGATVLVIGAGAVGLMLTRLARLAAPARSR